MTKTIDKIEFLSNINIDNGYVMNPLGKMKSVMELYSYSDGMFDEKVEIEWYVQQIDEIVTIGIEYDIDKTGKKIVTGYDGVFELPEQAIQLLEKNGFNCDEVKG